MVTFCILGGGEARLISTVAEPVELRAGQSDSALKSTWEGMGEGSAEDKLYGL